MPWVGEGSDGGGRVLGLAWVGSEALSSPIMQERLFLSPFRYKMAVCSCSGRENRFFQASSLDRTRSEVALTVISKPRLLSVLRASSLGNAPGPSRCSLQDSFSGGSPRPREMT